MSCLLKHKFLDFKLPSGTLWSFPTTPTVVTNLTEEERLCVPTIADYRELLQKVIKEVQQNHIFIKLVSMHNPSIHITLSLDERYAATHDVDHNIIFRNYKIISMDLLDEHAYTNNWNTKLIFPCIIKKPQ